MRHLPLVVAALLAVASPAANAADPALDKLLEAARIPFEVDQDGDYKIVYEWSAEKRSQLVYVSGTVEELSGVRLYEVFSPALVVDGAGIDPALARRLLVANAGFKFGAWELSGKTLYFGGKIAAGTPADQFETLVSVIAGIADDMELELAPGKDDL